jgi:hypothetical protein
MVWRALFAYSRSNIESIDPTGLTLAVCNLPTGNQIAMGTQIGLHRVLAERTTKVFFIAVLTVTWPFGLPAQAADTNCLETETALEYWRPLRAEATTTKLPVDALALELISCLGSPNPALRDGIGYELYTHWLRNEKFTDATRRALLIELSSNLAVAKEDAGLIRSFSALILAELMRSDSNRPFMSDAQRQELLDAAIAALKKETDFRGLESDIGWVHPVAHMADLLWRFTLHSQTTSEQAEIILAAVKSKIAPAGVAYSFNEGDRLARVVSTIIRRELIQSDVLATWLESFQAPESMQKWSDAFQSPEGMAQLHNTKQFLRALSDQLGETELDSRIAEPLQSLVDGFTLLI